MNIYTYIEADPKNLITPFYLASICINPFYYAAIPKDLSYTSQTQLVVKLKSLTKIWKSAKKDYAFWLSITEIDKTSIQSLGLDVAVTQKVRESQLSLEARIITDLGTLPDFNNIATGSFSFLHSINYTPCLNTKEVSIARLYCKYLRYQQFESYLQLYPKSKIWIHQGALTNLHFKELLSYKYLPHFYLDIETFQAVDKYILRKPLPEPLWFRNYRQKLINERLI